MKYRIFISEDDPGISGAISDLLKDWDMDVRRVEDFRNVLGEFTEYNPHLVIMDITLPFMGGYYWCREIRKISSVPIIFISSASDNLNIVMAMDEGGDDFIAKPFDRNVLLAKIQALLRRTYDFGSVTPILEHRGLVLNTSDNSFSYCGNKTQLTKNEYRILFILLQNKGRIISREMLMQELWDTDSFVDENTLSVNIGRLRKKITAAGLPDFITTKFGVGYIIE